MNFSSRKPSFISIFFLLTCFIMMLLGINLFVNSIVKMRKCTETVTAVVVDEVITHSERKDADGYHTVSDYHKPVFRYDYNGREYTVISEEGSDPPRYNIGDYTELKIDPSNPEYYYEPSSNITFILGTIFGTLGLVGTTIFLVVIFKRIGRIDE
ncbi:MAG: DUF3592 domain-containing protein [Lachnospiraceae bacterium]|nr:DUF3592 domain-containing protein [Lachnospiraceae bacterium]